MSADNTIVILGTVTNWKKHPSGFMEKIPTKKVYRVTHVHAWDNYDYYLNNEIYNLGCYLNLVFEHSPVFDNLDEATSYAWKLHDEIGYVEYGVQLLETDYVFFGD